MKIIQRYITVITTIIVFQSQGVLMAQAEGKSGSQEDEPFTQFADYFLGTWESD
jgi:hypothetical protein